MKTLLFLIIIIFVGCEIEGGTQTDEIGAYNVKVIDSCEYIEYSYGLGSTSVYSITHKGNCRFCLQRKCK